MVELSSVLREELGRDIPIVTLFQYPTVELLADYLSEQRAGDDLLERAGGRAEKRARPRAAEEAGAGQEKYR